MRLDHGQCGVFPTLIVPVGPPRYLAYRWASGFPGEVATANNATLVEFFLEPEADGPRLRVVETGFASVPIPPERAEAAGYDSHSEGWRGIVEILQGYVEK